MRIKVVLNASAGSLLDQPIEEVTDRIARGFADAGLPVTVIAVTGTEISDALEQACSEGVDAVVVGGGDGTIASAARHLVGSSTALGILPLGTMNLLARDLGIPADLDDAVKALATGRIQAIDACDVNGHVFLNNSVLGMYPRMVEERERQRGVRHLGKWTAMGLAALRVLRHFPILRLDIDFDGQIRQRATPVLAVANNVYDDQLGRLLHRDRLDAGHMAVYVARHQSPWRLLTLMARLWTGGWARDRDLESRVVRTLTVRVRRRRVRVANDGEVLRLKPPLHYRVLPSALKVLVPHQG